MWTLHSIVLNGLVPKTIKCLSQHNLAIDAQEDARAAAGSLYTRFVSILSQDAMLDITSYAIDDIVNLCGLAGLPIGATLPYTSLDLFYADYDDFGLLKPGNVHARFRMEKAIMCWQTIACQTNQDATIAVKIGAMDPDVVPAKLPIEVLTAVGLPTAGVDDTRFSLGPITLGAQTIGCVQSCNITAGQQMQPLRCGSDVYPKSFRVSPIKPTIEIGTQDFAALGTKIPFPGRAATQANSSVFFRKRLNQQVGYFAKDTNNHLRFTLAGLCRVSSHQATAGEPGETSIRVTTIDDGTNAPLVASVNQQIP